MAAVFSFLCNMFVNNTVLSLLQTNLPHAYKASWLPFIKRSMGLDYGVGSGLSKTKHFAKI